MEAPPTETHPDDPNSLPPARRRRARRRLVPHLSADERANYLEAAAKRTSPTFDFFLFSLLAAAIIAVGIIGDSPYLFVLGALLSPLMAPVVGISLSTVLGSGRSFTRALGGLLTGCFFVLIIGALAGFGAQLWFPLELFQAHIHAQLTWPPFLVIGLGAILTSATLIREKQNPSIPSAALAYGLYIPLTIAGFGLGSGVPHLWPDGLVVFAVHLVWIILLGAGTLAFMGFRPYTLFGYSLGGVVALVGIILAIGFGGAGAVVVGDIGLPTPIPSPTFTLTPTQTLTPTPIPPTATLTPTISPTITTSPTQTQTATPTPVPPVQAWVRTEGELGGVLRQEPNRLSPIVVTILNDTLVIILPDTPVTQGGAVWVKVQVLNMETETVGWIQRNLLVTATPSAE
ncbi:MAG: DUF389 domain-containing protein [Chloroflexi bacterium]|nr:DUF389 domain-containing protein [Chloroflexota bacterium]